MESAAELEVLLSRFDDHLVAQDASDGSSCFSLRLHTPSSRIDWHAEVERHRAQADGLPCSELKHRGAFVPSVRDDLASTPPSSVIAWQADWPSSELVVLALHATNQAGAAQLVAAALHVAEEHKLSRVRLWESADAPVREVLKLHTLSGAAREQREGKLPMIKWLQPCACSGTHRQHFQGVARVGDEIHHENDVAPFLSGPKSAAGHSCMRRLMGLQRAHWW